MGVRSDPVAGAIAELAGLLLGEERLEATLARVSRLAVSALPGCDAADLTLLGRDNAITAAPTDRRALLLDDAQYSSGEGPCLDAAREQRPNVVDSTRTDRRWPHFCHVATQVGILSAAALPLHAHGEPVGALNLYSNVVHGFPETDMTVAKQFATQAGIAIMNARTHAALLETTTQLNEALESRAVIDQAKGILMATESCSAAEAFDRLRTRSQHKNRKLRVVAHQIVDAIQHVTNS